MEPTTQTSPEDKTNKILIAVFVILFIVLGGELSFLLISSHNNKIATPSNVDNALIVINPSPKPTPLLLDTPMPAPVKTSSNSAIPQPVLDTIFDPNGGLTSLRKGILKGMTVDYTVEGVISKIDYPPRSGPYYAQITIKEPSGNSNSFFYYEQDTKILTIIDGATSKNIPFTQLSFGSRISIHVVFDLFSFSQTNDIYKATKVMQITKET